MGTTHRDGEFIRLPRASMRLRADDEQRLVAELVAEPGFAPGPHVHRRHEELFYVLEGAFEFLAGDEVMHVTAGDVVAVAPGVVHDFRNPGPGPARILGIATPGGLGAYFRALGAAFADGSLSRSLLAELRLSYETDPVDLVWSP